MRDPQSQPSTPDADGAANSPERTMLIYFLIILALNIAGSFWLSLRSDINPSGRVILDVMMQGATGALLVSLAFRALLLYRFTILDLLAMVLVLSLAVKIVVDVLRAFSAMGLLGTRSEGERLGEIIQSSLIAISLLVSGAAWGLRVCSILKIEKPASRITTLVSAMLILPAAAGTVAFPVLIFSNLVGVTQPPSMLKLFVLWFFSIAVTGLNTACFLRTLTLKAEIAAREKMP